MDYTTHYSIPTTKLTTAKPAIITTTAFYLLTYLLYTALYSTNLDVAWLALVYGKVCLDHPLVVLNLKHVEHRLVKPTHFVLLSLLCQYNILQPTRPHNIRCTSQVNIISESHRGTHLL